MAQLTKGETLVVDFPADADTAVVYVYGKAKYQANATRTADGWRATFDTSAWAVGTYGIKAMGTASGVKRVVGTWTLILDPDPAEVADNTDVRSQARQIVDAIEQMMAGSASEGVRRMRINNRELEQYSIAELLQLLNYWRGRVKSESRAGRARGTLGNRIAVRF